MNHQAFRLAVLLLAVVQTTGRRLSQQDYSYSAESTSPAAAALDLDMEGNIIVDVDPPPMQQGQESLIGMQFSPDPHASRDHISMIVNGELGLAALRYSPHSFKSMHDGEYADVYGEFCAYDLTVNRKDPAAYATVSVVMSESDHCAEHRYTLPLQEVMHAIELAGVGKSKIRTIPLSGLLFHEGYSGAGLVSNALATFDSALVVSEHTALRDALDACDVERNRYLVEDCSSPAQHKLVKDVVTLLSRTPDPTAKHLFLKLSSGSSAYIPMMHELYPDVAWTFVYRNAEHALAKTMERTRSSACIKSRRNPSTALSTKSVEHHVDLESLTNFEVCALHLSSLLDVATRVHEESGTGLLVSYDHDILPSSTDVVLDVILPYLGLKEEIDADTNAVREKVSNVLAQKSNHAARGDGGVPIWTKESIGVSDEVRAASMLFMKDSTDAMEDVARKRRGL